MDEKVSPSAIFSEKIRGLASRERQISMDDVEMLESYFKRLLEDRELRADIELTRLVGG